jgi:hypothetical protein
LDASHVCHLSLLPPYDTSITDVQWKTYHDERSALDAIINADDKEVSQPMQPGELRKNTFEVLRTARMHVADTICGAILSDKDRKKEIARTIRGSVYYLSVKGSD